MNTQTFHASNIQLALREVRNALGPDAAIVSTGETDDGVEVVAGMAGVEPELKAPAPAEPVVPSPRRSRGAALPASAPMLRQLGTSILHAAGMSPTQVLQALGLSPDLRARVLEGIATGSKSKTKAKAVATEVVLAALASQIPIQDENFLESGGRIAVLGGTGVGKTTTVVKLAAHFARMHGPQSVAIVNTDNLRIGASEQLRRYGSLMGLKVCNVKDPGGLGAALKRLSKCKLVLVDTAGTSHDRARLVQQLGVLGNAGIDVRCYLAMSCNTQTAVLDRTAREFAGVDLRGSILTKCDETASLGAGLSIAARHGLPISFVTTGPRVPADILAARSDWLVDQALALLEESYREDEQMQEANTVREMS